LGFSAGLAAPASALPSVSYSIKSAPTSIFCCSPANKLVITPLPSALISTYQNYYGRFRETCINQLFSTRKDTHPLFAYWFWEVESAPQSSAERFYLTVYVRFRHWTTLDYLKTLLSPLKDTTVQVDVHPTQGGVGEVQMLLMKRLKYNHVFNYSVPEYGIDIWRWGGEEIEYPLTQEWSIGNFLESPNYRQPVGMRYAYLDWILHLIHNNNWVHLFRLYDYEKE
jgi:hypothetical protein